MTMESHVGGPADRSHIANIMGIGEAGLRLVFTTILSSRDKVQVQTDGATFPPGLSPKTCLSVALDRPLTWHDPRPSCPSPNCRRHRMTSRVLAIDPQTSRLITQGRIGGAKYCKFGHR